MAKEAAPEDYEARSEIEPDSGSTAVHVLALEKGADARRPIPEE